MTLYCVVLIATEVCPRPEGGGDFAPALGGGSGANRGAGTPEAGDSAVERLLREARHD